MATKVVITAIITVEADESDLTYIGNAGAAKFLENVVSLDADCVRVTHMDFENT